MAVLLCCDEVHLRIEATFKEETLQTNLAQSAGAVAQRGNTAAQRESGAAQPAAPRRAASPLTSQTPAAPRRGRIVQTDAAAPPFRFFNSQLLKITQLTPTMRRFTLRGASLNQLADPGLISGSSWCCRQRVRVRQRQLRSSRQHLTGISAGARCPRRCVP